MRRHRRDGSVSPGDVAATMPNAIVAPLVRNLPMAGFFYALNPRASDPRPQLPNCQELSSINH